MQSLSDGSVQRFVCVPLTRQKDTKGPGYVNNLRCCRLSSIFYTLIAGQAIILLAYLPF